MTDPTTEIIPYLYVRDVPAALEWLAGAFGFQETMRHVTPKGTHAEMTLNGRRIMLGGPHGGTQPTTATATAAAAAADAPTQGIFVYLPDVTAHHARAVQAGANPQSAPVDHGYGLTYTVHDPDGHVWYFTEAPAPP